MERPESDTASNLNIDQDVLSDEPLAAGPDLTESGKLDFLVNQAKQNPWISIAATGVGALAVGFLLGRLLKTNNK